MQPGDQEYQQLFQIFREECDEHIQKLNDGLMILERQPQQAPIDEILRSAHSLKGAARMMGFKNLETLAHYLETLLTQLNRGEREVTPIIIDALYRDIDAVGQGLNALIEGKEPSSIDALVDELRVAAGESAPAQPVAKAAASDGSKERVTAVSGQAPASRDATPALSSIRVQTERLDTLINQAGELLVTKIEALDNLRQIEDTLDALEEWRRRLARETHSPSFGRIEKVGDDLSRVLQRISENTRRLELLVDEIHEGVRGLRLLPLSTILEPFSRMVRDLSRDLGKDAELRLEGSSTSLDKKILEELREPLIHLVRNAIDHGIEPPEERERKGKPARGTLFISARQEGTKIVVMVKDDGRGLDPQAIAASAVKKGLVLAEEVQRWPEDEILDLIFRPGFSTAAGVTEVSGRGIGLDAVVERLERLKGSILTESKPGAGVTFTLSLPLTLSTTHALLFHSGGDIFCLPTDALEKTLLLAPDEITYVEGKATVIIDGTPLAFAWLADVLNLPKSELKNGAIPALLLHGPRGKLVFGVEALLGEEEVVVKALGKFFGHIPQVSGGTILGKGEIALILNPNELLRSVAHQVRATAPIAVRPMAPRPAARKRVLVVEDTLTTRTLEKNILEAAGFDVTTAVDGEDGLIKLYEKSFDIVVSDVQMPRLDGFLLTERIKKDERFKDLPVILVTSMQTDADKKRGIEAGADAYLTKAVFDQKRFLEIVQRFA
ncbi:MAG TPA: hybrid sensor histidine kinase/response regulator [Candidatus Binatia bacterium]|jgi:two-component system chemotaxis sensor kinase CheA